MGGKEPLGVKRKAIGCRLVPAGYLWIHQQEQHSDNWPPLAATPYPAAPDSPLCRGRIGCSTLLLVSCSAKLSTHSPTSGAILHNSRGRSPENRSGRRSRFRTEPLAPRGESPAAPSTLAAKPRQPSGIPPSADSSSKAHRLKYRTQQKAPVFRLVLFYYSCPCRTSWPPWPCTP